MTTIGNMFVRPLLRSSAGNGIHELALLCFEGRRSGRRYEVPVEYHELDGEPLILPASAWKRNLRGGADVELVTAALHRDEPSIRSTRDISTALAYGGPVSSQACMTSVGIRTCESSMQLTFGFETLASKTSPATRRFPRRTFRMARETFS